MEVMGGGGSIKRCPGHICKIIKYYRAYRDEIDYGIGSLSFSLEWNQIHACHSFKVQLYTIGGILGSRGMSLGSTGCKFHPADCHQ